ncbi:MAG: hypothetical protein D6742_01785, partial [Cyanobacteria bacterium J069]
AKPGDRLLMAVDRRGQPHPRYPFWNASTNADPARLRADLELLPQLAESGLCDTAKDISNGGVIGTTLMLLETSGCGAVIDLDAVIPPPEVSLDWWLTCFPSYGFLLSVCPEQVGTVQQHFGDRHLICQAIGEIQPTSQLVLLSQGKSVVFWDFAKQSLTGFSPAP